MSQQDKVRVFHTKHGLATAHRPCTIGPEQQERRRVFMHEELCEYVDANEAGDIVAVADALGDLLYVVLGTACEHGINLAPVFDEIHRSNMTKHHLDPGGKGGKGDAYDAPRLTDLLFGYRHSVWGK